MEAGYCQIWSHMVIPRVKLHIWYVLYMHSICTHIYMVWNMHTQATWLDPLSKHSVEKVVTMKKDDEKVVKSRPVQLVLLVKIYASGYKILRLQILARAQTKFNKCSNIRMFVHLGNIHQKIFYYQTFTNLNYG